MFFFKLGCDIGGAKELGVIYFPTNWGAKELQNLPNHRVVKMGWKKPLKGLFSINPPHVDASEIRPESVENPTAKNLRKSFRRFTIFTIKFLLI